MSAGVEARVVEIAREAVARARAREPAPELWPRADDMAELETAVAELVRSVLASVENADGGGDLDARGVGRLVEAGMSPAVTCAIVRSTVEVVHDYLWQEFDGGTSTDGRHRLQTLGGAALSALADSLGLVYDAYGEGEGDREARVTALVRQMLRGGLEPADAEEGLRRLGVEGFEPPFVLMGVAAASGRRAEVEHAARQYASRLGFPLLPVCFMDGDPGLRGFAVLLAPRTGKQAAAPSDVALDAAARAAGVAVVVDHVDAVEALPEAFDAVRCAVGFARVASRRSSERRVFTVLDLVAYVAVAAMEESVKGYLLETALAPVLAQAAERASRGLAVLRAWCAHPGATQDELAELVGYSRGAVKYQLAQIEERTGLSLGRDQVFFAFAVHLYDILEEDLPPPGDHRWGRRPFPSRNGRARR